MITINLDKAKDIWRDKIRQDRKVILENLDIQYLRALEIDDMESKQTIAHKKQLLRDAPADPRILNALSIEQLIDINPIQEIGY